MFGRIFQLFNLKTIVLVIISDTIYKNLKNGNLKIRCLMERDTLDPKEGSLREEELVEIQLFSSQNVDHTLATTMFFWQIPPSFP